MQAFLDASLPSAILIPSAKSAPQPKPKAIYIPKRSPAEDTTLPSPTASLPSLSSSPLSSSGSSFLQSPTSRPSSLPVSAAHSDDSSFEEGDAFSDAAPSSFMNSPAFEPVRSSSPVPTFDDVFAVPAPSARIYSKFELLKLGEDFKSAISSSPSRRGNDQYSFLHAHIGRQVAQSAPWIYAGKPSPSLSAAAPAPAAAKSKKAKKSGDAPAKKGNSKPNGSKKGKKASAATASATEKPQLAVPAKPAPMTRQSSWTTVSGGSSSASSPLSTTSSLPAHSIRGPELPPSTGGWRKKPSQFTRVSGRADESDWWKKRGVAA